MQMQDIEQRAKVFAGARDELASRLQDLRDEQEAAKRRRLQGIKNSLARFTAAHGELKEAIETSPGEFRSPKTRVLHGIKVGFMKQRGKLELGDIDTVVQFTIQYLGDPAYVSEYDPQAHGMADQRVQSILNGYENGFLGCNISI